MLLDTVAHAIELARELAYLEDRLEIERVRLRAPAYPVQPPRSRWEAIQQGDQAVANHEHLVLRRRFSWVDEYAHVLFDRELRGTVSREGERDELPEVRANALAASFPLPATGARDFLEGLGKGARQPGALGALPTREDGELFRGRGRAGW